MIESKCDNNITIESQVRIVNRIKKLSEWQEEQKRLLDQRQNMQRKMLGLEHQNMYEKLGLFHSSDLFENNNGGIEISATQITERLGSTLDSKIKEMENRFCEGKIKDNNEAQAKFCKEKNYNYNNNNDFMGEEDFVEPEIKDMKPKRPFLKRGEGIKQRYKISPESLRLNNLPRYKYATNHPKFKNLHKGKLAPKAKISQEITKEKTTTKKVDFIVETEKFDENEKKFRQMLKISKANYSSTPDEKLQKSVTSPISITLPNIRVDATNKESKKPSECKGNGHAPEPVVSAKHQDNVETQYFEPYAAITWSKVLDPQLLQPIPVGELRGAGATDNATKAKERRNREYMEDDGNLTIFELLERKAAEGQIDMNSSYLRKFLDEKINREQENDEGEYDIPPIDRVYVNGGLRPVVEEVLTDSDSDDYYDNSNTDAGNVQGAIQVSTCLSNEGNSDSVSNFVDKVDLHVRFSEQNTTCEHDSHVGEGDSSVQLDDEENVSVKSSNLFHQLKDTLFKALLAGKSDGILGFGGGDADCGADTTEQHKQEDTEIQSQRPSALTQELLEKSNMVKLRLEELENEIASFKSNNMELIRAKQEYELEKAQFNQECTEIKDRLKDEKIQMEMYLHDERMKIEEDRRKFEQQVRMQKQALSNKEVALLREEVSALHMQLKQKDQLYASGQARLRVQIKNLERDQKQLHEEIERLTKENKRLETEKVKIEREGNNKMLLEINRNIAKLAPKLTAITANNTSPNDNHSANRCINKYTKSSCSPPSIHKSNSKVHRAVKAPPNTRNASKTNLINVENTHTVYKADTAISRYSNEEVNDDECSDDDDDDIMAELEMTKNSSKPIQSTSHSNSLKETVELKLERGKHKENEIEPTKDNEAGENFRREIINPDGSRDIWYPNGNLKKISADGMNIRMLYFNKDIKETNVNEGTVKYYYAETNIWHTTYLDGLEILEFPNGQTEHRYKNGIVEIHLPDNSVKITNPAEKDKLEEWRFVDGTNLIQMRNGDKILMLPNGQKEIHTKLNKRREYPDGTVKLVYPDGSQETRYANGRVRLKDKGGNLVLDTERN